MFMFAGAACAAGECRYAVTDRTTLRPEQRVLSVGEVDRRFVAALAQLHNQGPHDIRATFDGAAPRVLAKAQSEPGEGSFAAAVALRTVECLAAKSVVGLAGFGGRAPAGGADRDR
jgi:hypothetical protein